MVSYIISGIGVLISLICCIRLFSNDRQDSTLNAIKDLKSDIADLKEEYRKVNDVTRNLSERVAVLEDRTKRN